MRLEPSAVSAIWLRLRTEKSLTSPGRMRWRRARISRGLGDGRLHVARARGLHVDLIHIAGEARLEIVGIGRRRIGPVQRRLLLARRRDADHFAFGGRERDHDKVVLIGTERRLAFGRQNPDDAQRYALDLDDGTEGIFVGAEQLAKHRLTQHDHQRGLVFVIR